MKKKYKYNDIDYLVKEVERNGIPNECINCHETRIKGEAIIYSYLNRTDEEIQKTFNILNWKIKGEDFEIEYEINNYLDKDFNLCKYDR